MKVVVALNFPERGDLRFAKVFDFLSFPTKGPRLTVKIRDRLHAIEVEDVDYDLDSQTILANCQIDEGDIEIYKHQSKQDELATSLQTDPTWKQFGDHFDGDNFPDGPSQEDLIEMLRADASQEG